MASEEVRADHVHRFRAPVWTVFAALTDDRHRWLRLQPGEVEPTVLEAVPVERVIWSSFWPVSPSDTIEFDLSRYGGGTAMRFRWVTSSPPDERGVNITRQRLNRKFAADLRGWVDSVGSPVSWDHPSDA